MLTLNRTFVSFLGLLAFSAGGCCSLQAALSANDRAALQKTHAAANDPVTKTPAKVDWPAYVDAVYDADARLMPPDNPIVEGRDAIRTFFSSLPPLSVFKIENVEIDGDGSVAYIRGTYTISLTPPDTTTINDQGKFVQVWRKRGDGTWRCIVDIYNSDLPPTGINPPPPRSGR